MDVRQLLKNAAQNADTVIDASKSGNMKVLASLLGPALRGFVMQKGKTERFTDMPSQLIARFTWEYKKDKPELDKLYRVAKRSQWDGATALDWSIQVDPFHTEIEILKDKELPFQELKIYRKLPRKKQQEHRYALLSWLLSQFLHGEQGALFAACQATQAVEWLDGKLYGSTQVVDEGRHVEVFHRYLTEKLEKMYFINDNLYVIIDAIMSDSRWDLKFLGMQILIEGLALGAFGTLRNSTEEPLLAEMLKKVIIDEARHVHFGVVSLRNYFVQELSSNEVREREDWAYEMCLLLRNRFLAHEFYDEYYAHAMTRSQWNEFILNSNYMESFRRTMFRRIIPNLREIGLLSDRVKPLYEKIGLGAYEAEKSADQLTPEDLVD